MGFSAGVGVFSSQPDAQGVGLLQQCQRLIRDNSISMGENLLDDRFKVPSISRALKAPITIENLREVLVDVAISAPPAQVDRLTLQAWLVGDGETSLATDRPQKNNS
ncbi:hypothetical protein RF55_9825 [Lasius niger]|uniref:Uncharacterized protein n=1 Tax=Lasius niger TaxID=67767 RepID=A0A0J7KJH8_LASNI|nr:hypothetical protein RF55_9825 [Lasius niger]